MLRRSEAAALDLEHYDRAAGGLRVLGKGNKERFVSLSAGARRAIEDWVAVRGDAPGALLCAVNKAGRITVRHVTDQAIYDRTQALATAAGVAHFSPHDLSPGLTAAQSGKWAQVIEIVIESPVSTEIGPVTTADWIFAGLG